MHKLSIVLSTHQTKFESVAFKGDFEKNIAKIAGFGYDGVELAIRDPALVDISALESSLSKHGLKVPAIGTGQAYGEERLSFANPDQSIREAAIARIHSHIPLAKRLNAIVVIGLIRGMTPSGQSKAQSLKYLVECLKICAESAAGQGVRLAIEPLNRYETDLIHTVGEALKLIQQVGSPCFGLLLDTFHMNIEEPNIEDSIIESGANTFHFHVSDSNRWYPSAGHIDFRAMIQALNSAGYQGWISGEFMPSPDAETAAKLSIDHLNHLYQLI